MKHRLEEGEKISSSSPTEGCKMRSKSEHFCRGVGLLPPGGSRRQPKGPQCSSEFGVSGEPYAAVQ